MESRIKEHPILGEYEKGKLVKFTHDGKTYQGYEGEPIAAALKAAGVMVHRYTAKKHKPRGIFCAIGRCTDCVMIVNGEPNIRTCMTPLKEGMTVDTQYGTGSIPFEDINIVEDSDEAGVPEAAVTASDAAVIDTAGVSGTAVTDTAGVSETVSTDGGANS